MRERDEHTVARWERLGIDYNILGYSNEEACIWVNFNKVSRKSWGRTYKFYLPVTWLNTCKACGKTGIPRKVSQRNDCYRSEWGTPMLCCGCWNSARALVRRFNEAKELLTITRKLRRAKADERKNYRRAA